MNRKTRLFLGVVFLVSGVLLRIFSNIKIWPIVIIVIGASFKISYVISKIRSGEYKPGYEVFLLYTGLIMFFTGVFFRSHGRPFNPAILMAPGIALKLSFIGIFIKKSRKKTSAKEITV